MVPVLQSLSNRSLAAESGARDVYAEIYVTLNRTARPPAIPLKCR